VPSRSTRLLAFATGEFDLTQTADVTPPLFNEVKKNAPNSICAMLPTNVTTHMLVNREKPPFDNPELRRAMLLSLDRQAFIDILALGKARLAVNMMPPPLPPEPMLEPLSPPPQLEQARARASTPVAAGSLFQVTLMPLLSQETRVKPCDVRSSPA